MTSRDSTQSKKGVHLSGDKCVICGWDKKDPKGRSLVIGAHVRAFQKQRDYDRFDNIIALCPNHHLEFDRGCIAIDPLQEICIHINKGDEFNKKKILGNIKHVQPGHFDYHQKNVFNKR